VIKKSQDGKIRVRTRIVAFDGEVAEGVCTKCGTTIKLPLELSAEIRKALGHRRLIVKLRNSVDNSNTSP
jgi:hypothetical protein